MVLEKHTILLIYSLYVCSLYYDIPWFLLYCLHSSIFLPPGLVPPCLLQRIGMVNLMTATWRRNGDNSPEKIICTFFPLTKWKKKFDSNSCKIMCDVVVEPRYLFQKFHLTNATFDYAYNKISWSDISLLQYLLFQHHIDVSVTHSLMANHIYIYWGTWNWDQ